MIRADSTLTDIAFEVCTALDAAGVQAVLTGGSAATFYAAGAYQSADLDFVITFEKGDGGAEAMAALGYRPEHGSYVHGLSLFAVEFPPGPLMIGSERIEEWSTIRRIGNQVLHVLSPTDAVRDRLSAFLYWDDFSGLEQALAVFASRPQDIDLGRIERWCAEEGYAEKFVLFKARFQDRGLDV